MHKGLYRYKRLSFGINAAAEKFQNVIASAIDDIPNVKNISDDIIVYGKDMASHNVPLDKLLKRFESLNLTLNKKKCEFHMNSIAFFGMVFSENGMTPDPNKVKVIQCAKSPESASEYRSLLGMSNYVSRFIPGYEDLVAPMLKLIKKNAVFEWGEAQQKALDELKVRLTTDNVLSYFDPNKATTIFVDASPRALGAVLTQEGHVVAYGSKTCLKLKRVIRKLNAKL